MVFGFSAIEVIAGLFALLVLAKVITILIKKEAWFNTMVKPSMTLSKMSATIYLILAVIIFYFLIQSFTIVEIFAILAFPSILIFLGLLVYSKDMLVFAKRVYSKKFNGWVWIQIIIWTALSLWVLWEILI